ncbi:MAG TPA: hypothetical protein VN372_10525 [Methanospirillum sp.]|nr:hypothetical protein [Methanospirillum sp.]
MRLRTLIPFLILILLVLLTGCTDTPSSKKQLPTESPTISQPSTQAASETTQQIEVTPSQTIEKIPEVTKVPSQTPRVNVNGLDKGTALVMGEYVLDGIMNMSPIYSDIRDDFAVKDYTRMATDSLKLQRYTEKVLEDLSFDSKVPNKDLFGDISNQDLMVFKKYIGYLNSMKKLSESIQLPLSFIKDDPSKVGLRDKIDSFSPAMYQSREAKEQLESLMTTCDDFGAICGQNFDEVKNLKKPLEFLESD